MLTPWQDCCWGKLHWSLSQEGWPSWWFFSTQTLGELKLFAGDRCCFSAVTWRRVGRTGRRTDASPPAASHKSKYIPHVFVNILSYLFIGYLFHIISNIFFNIEEMTLCYNVTSVYSLYNSVNLLSAQKLNTQPLMSELLATKVSTSLSENVQIGPNQPCHVTH